MKAIYFGNSMSVAIDFGQVVACEVGTVVEFEDDSIAETLLKRPNIMLADDRHKHLRRLKAAETMVPAHKAKMIAPPPSADMILAEHRKRAQVRAIERELRGDS